jgi:membrane protein DedA with SNARE-associated domain
MNTEALQAVGLALSTFVQEDAPTIAAALLASAGQLDWRVAFAACFAGIWVGDALLYLLARGAGRPLLATRLARRFVKPESIARGEEWFAQRGTWALVLSRFVPGLRLPTYLAAGFLRVPFPRFLIVTGGAVLVWTAALFAGAHWLGGRVQSVMENSGGAMALAGGVMLLGLVAWRKRARPSGRFNTRQSEILNNAGRSASTTVKRPEVRVPSRVAVWFARWAHWEFWPAWLFYIPVFINYLWLAICYRGFKLPTAANPGIFSGGIVGESKIATLQELHATSSEFTAEAHRIEGASIEERQAAFLRLIAACDISYPLILKPDVGQRGVGVKLIRDERQALEYLTSTNAPLICQRYAPGPYEIGVFYSRFPGEPRGRIFSITEKLFPIIIGDGVRAVEELIWADSRARFIAGKYFARLEGRRDEILPRGETLKLVEAGNHAQGCIFQDGMRLWSEELERRIDEVSRKLNGFFIGRYDIRYSSEADLRAGRNFQIIELNGAASEATSIYDARNSLWSAYRTLFQQWDLVFSIGAANRRLGSAPTPFSLLWRTWRQTAALTATYPAAD